MNTTRLDQPILLAEGNLRFRGSRPAVPNAKIILYAKPAASEPDKKSAPRILLADSHATVRYGLRLILLEEIPDARIEECGEPGEFLQLLAKQKWDLVLLDIVTTEIGSMDLLRKIRSLPRRSPIIVMSNYSQEHFELRALRAGAIAFISKKYPPSMLLQIVHDALDGKLHVSSYLATSLAVGRQGRPDGTTILSDREFEVLRKLVTGKSGKEIASELSLSVKTISTYRARVMEKLKLKSFAEVIRYTIHHGLVE